MRISTGVTVNVSANTERWLSEIRTGRAFTRGTGLAAVAANNGHVQLLNPAASGVNLIVRGIKFAVNVLGEIRVARYDTALGTLVGNGLSLLAGGTAALAEIRTATNVGALGTLMRQIPALASTSVELSPEWWIELGPGEGVVGIDMTVNDTVYGNFDWIEVP